MEADITYLPISKFENLELMNSLQVEHNLPRNKQIEELIDEEEALSHEEDRNGYSVFVKLMLEGMEMEKYCPLFEKYDISLDVLVLMNENDFLELGITDSNDRKFLADNLEKYRISFNNDENECSKETQSLEDDILMTTNVHKHLIEINSYLSDLYKKICDNPPEDYLICNHETSLKYLKFSINHAIVQARRMSHLLFEGQFEGKNLITSALHVNKISLPQFKRQKLMKYYEKKIVLRKRRVFTTILIIAGIAFAMKFISKNK